MWGVILDCIQYRNVSFSNKMIVRKWVKLIRSVDSIILLLALLMSMF